MFTVERGVDRLLLPSGETLEMEVQHEIFAIDETNDDPRSFKKNAFKRAALGWERRGTFF